MARTDYGREAEKEAREGEFNYRDWDYSRFTPEDKQALYEARYPERNHKKLPEDQDWVEFEGTRVKRCEAQTKMGRRCNSAARKGHDVCRMHGAGTEEKPGGISKWRRPIYKLKNNTDVQEKAEKYLNDDRLDDLKQELALQTALVNKAMENDDVSIDGLMRYSDTIAKNKKRRADIEAQSSLTMKEVQLLVSHFIQVIKQYVPEAKQDAALSDLRDGLPSGD